MAPSSPVDGVDGPFDFDDIDLSENIADYLWGLLVWYSVLGSSWWWAGALDWMAADRILRDLRA